MNDMLSLASHLRALDDEQLARTIRARNLRPGPIKDFFDLAEALLDRISIQSQLTHLNRGTLAVIAAIAELGRVGPAPTAADVAVLLGDRGTAPDRFDLDSGLANAVAAHLIIDDDGRFTAYDSVAAQLRSWPAFGLPSLTELASAPPPAVLGPVSDIDGRFIDRVASERAFAATTEITELLIELEREPARELARGGIALPDTKRLANAMAVDLDTVGRFVVVAENAGLVAREAGAWMITDAGGAWLLESSGARWRALATGWHSRLPEDVRGLLRARGHALWGDSLRSFVEWLYPAGGETMHELLTKYSQEAEALGITANLAPSRPGTLMLTQGPDAAAQAMAALLPKEVDRVYLQHDLSIVATGPLTPGVDYRLRSLADVESRALASSYRVSASSMNRAMAAGETAESVREFLAGISITGIPQPLDYLIREASTRYGLIRAGDVAGEAFSREVGGPARSFVRSDDDVLLGTVLVDQNLSVLGLIRSGDHRLVSRFPLDTVFWALSDARYPVAAENNRGEIVALRRRRHAKQASPAALDPVRELIGRLRLGSDAEPEEAEEAWLARQLDAAIRTKSPLSVTVTMPNGSVVEYQLEPTSVAGGRLRGRDRRSAIERTLPLSSIVGVEPAPEVAD